MDLHHAFMKNELDKAYLQNGMAYEYLNHLSDGQHLIKYYMRKH